MPLLTVYAPFFRPLLTLSRQPLLCQHVNLRFALHRFTRPRDSDSPDFRFRIADAVPLRLRTRWPPTDPQFSIIMNVTKNRRKVPKSYFLSLFCLFLVYFGVCNGFLSCRGSRCSPHEGVVAQPPWCARYILHGVL